VKGQAAWQAGTAVAALALAAIFPLVFTNPFITSIGVLTLENSVEG